MTTANNGNNNLSPWQPGQSGNPSGRPRGTRDLAGYVLETTDGGKELVYALVSIARGVMPNVPVQEGCGVAVGRGVGVGGVGSATISLKQRQDPTVPPLSVTFNSRRVPEAFATEFIGTV